jgi:hypothetical protein
MTVTRSKPRERQPEQREPTATERIAALNERRAAGNGYIVAPPEPLTAQTFRSWLHSVAEVGSPGDVEVAWHYCRNPAEKAQLLNWYEETLRPAAGARYGAIQRQADAEQAAEHAAAVRRRERAQLERDIAQHKASIAELERKLALM